MGLRLFFAVEACQLGLPDADASATQVDDWMSWSNKALDEIGFRLSDFVGSIGNSIRRVDKATLRGPG